MPVVEEKWLAAIKLVPKDELDRLTQQLAGRVKELEERYVQLLPELEQEAKAFGAKVMEHFQRLGISSCGRDSHRRVQCFPDTGGAIAGHWLAN